ncbi:MAG TPA: PH domain-containing protein [Longimicrobium sp.]|jgi:membrane protein YdbS with pleckstrin-like domain
MFEGTKRWVLRLLRVPAEPRVPEGGRVVRVFRAAPAYYRYRLALWALGQLGALVGLIGSLLGILALLRDVDHPVLVFLLQAGEIAAWATFLVQLPFSLAVLRLDFEMRWYILSDRSLRIREGVVSVREKTITFANIQNISIRQNPLQRLLKLADVRVTTAGGGAGSAQGHGESVGESMHEAYFRGVDNAEEIRDVIAERVRLHRDAGLGDPDEPPPLPDAVDSDVLAAAVELRDEVRGLRRALVPGHPSS